MAEEKFEFQSEAAELLKMMINSVYSNRDIFLRELISNASDALDKRRIEKLRDSELADFAPEIRIERDKDKRTLSVSDNGIGMTRDEMIQYLGTIAKSGTRDFLAAAKQEGQSPLPSEGQDQLIGQFGVGFYSVFMVADRVEVVSRKLGSASACRFASDGGGSYTISDAERDCGTTVTLYLRPMGEEKDGGKDYTDEWTIRDLVKQYSDFIAWPIVMPVTRHKDGKETVEDEVINSQKAVWLRGESDVSEEEYREFYRHLTHDWKEPLAHIRLSAEGATSFKGLLFLPSEAPFDLFMNPKAGGISLYINRVFIMNDCTALIPEYMRFLRGVIDSDDLPLNLSREILQDEPLVRVIRRSTQRKVFNELKKMLEADREKYEKFWTAFGRVFKEGIIQDREHSKTILDLALFHTTKDEKEASGWTTLAAYKERMKPGQEGIYCLAGRDLSSLRASPKLEPFTKRGYEVLLMTDPVDEVILADAGVLDEGLKLVNVGIGNVTPEDEEERKAAEERLKGVEAEFAPLKEQAMSALADKLEDVRPTLTLTDSPACLRDSPNGLSVQMEQLLRAAGQTPPPQKRILELNVEHPLIKKLMEMAGQKSPQAADLLSILYDQSLILEGAAITDPAAFVRRLNDFMTRTLGA
ncbi:MAG: molecular chaperone HtpG [Synergistaceae bacterium]|nr:molecular chaperone HtpG [Synergistaceae bacterium]